ncbi:MAG: hypothetical protein FWG00_05625 [Coriobacteriia bacterium]|nr:hypothetical protein [Coriobacteriia bacterium]
MKKIVKFLVIVLCILVPLAMLPGCGLFVAGEIVAEDPVEDREAEAQDEPASADGLSDDIYSFMVQLDGEIYEFPAPYSEFAAKGWKIEETLGVDYNEETLKPNSYTGVVVAKNGSHQIYLTFVNVDADVKKVSDCNVGGIDLDSWDAETGTQLIFPGNIILGSSEAEVLAAYGEPSDSYDGDTAKHFTYSTGSYADAEISIDKEADKVISLSMRNLIARESSPEATGDAPDVVKNYKAPKTLGASWDSFTAKYGGTLYQMPIPVSELLSNGWTAVSDMNRMVNARGFDTGIELRKDNQVLRTSIRNYDDKQQPVKFCFVTVIEYYDNGAMVPIELPGGLTEKSDIKDFIKAYGKPTEQSDSSHFDYYTWGELYSSLTVSVDKEEGVITKIELDYDPKDLK